MQEQNNTVLFYSIKIINYDKKNNEDRTEMLSLGSLHLFFRRIPATKSSQEVQILLSNL
jgi:hypothetical protein